MDFVSILTRKNSLRSAVKELDLDSIDKVIADLADIKEAIKVQEAEKLREEQKREARIREIQKAMAAAGLTAEDLGGISTGKVKAKVPPKYRLMGQDGNLHEWSGRGRKPVVFREYEERGGKMKDLEIA